MNQADLIAGEVDVAIMGAQIDMGVGMRGAKYGPGSLRESLPVWGPENCLTCMSGSPGRGASRGGLWQRAN